MSGNVSFRRDSRIQVPERHGMGRGIVHFAGALVRVEHLHLIAVDEVRKMIQRHAARSLH